MGWSKKIKRVLKWRVAAQHTPTLCRLIRPSAHARWSSWTWAGWLRVNGWQWCWVPKQLGELWGSWVVSQTHVVNHSKLWWYNILVKHNTKDGWLAEWQEGFWFQVAVLNSTHPKIIEFLHVFFDRVYIYRCFGPRFGNAFSMTLKRQLSDAEEELRDLLTYKCPKTGKPRCPPCSAETLTYIAEGFFFL